MKEVKFYKYATVILIGLNVLIVAFFLFGKPKHHKPGQHMPLANRAVDLMELDESQNAQFEALVSIHKKDMESLNQLQKELLESYFKNVYDAENSPMNDYQLDKLQAIEGQKIESTYRHFEDIKTMLRTEQMDGFTQFMKGAMRHILMDSKLEKEPRPPRQ